MPDVSVSLGRSGLSGFQKNTLASAGHVPSRTVSGNISSMVFIYEEVSLSAVRFPKGLPNAISEMISRVRS